MDGQPFRRLWRKVGLKVGAFGAEWNQMPSALCAEKQLGMQCHMYGLSVEQVAALGAELGMDLQTRPESFAPERFVDLARALRKRSANPSQMSAGESAE